MTFQPNAESQRDASRIMKGVRQSGAEALLLPRAGFGSGCSGVGRSVRPHPEISVDSRCHWR
jgi:hypothetical protein